MKRTWLLMLLLALGCLPMIVLAGNWQVVGQAATNTTSDNVWSGSNTFNGAVNLNGSVAATAAINSTNDGNFAVVRMGLTSVAAATSISATTSYMSWIVTANVAIELPDPAAVSVGTWHRIKATHASGATVKTHNDGALIDGTAASHALTQYEACDFQTDGTNWYRMADYD